MKKIVILGAGTAGTIIANKLYRTLDSEKYSIVIVDSEKNHFYQPGFLFIPFSIYKRSQVIRLKKEFIPKGVQFILDRIIKIEPRQNRIHFQSNTHLSYDILVIATGCDTVAEELEGLNDQLSHNVFDFYKLEGALRLEKFLKNFRRGHLVVQIVEFPIKCPVAPLEFIFLADEYFYRRGIRDQVQLTFVTPLSGAFTKQRASTMLSGLLKKKNIHIVQDFNIERVDLENNEIISYDNDKIKYDALVTIPTNMGAKVIEFSQMGDELNFIPTDPYTLQAKEYSNVFVIGDATDLPTSKAGSVAHFESDILVKNILSFIHDTPLLAKFDGHSNCFIETGFHRAVLIDFNYQYEPVEGRFPLPFFGPLSLLKESYWNHYAKMSFYWIYWNRLIRGKSLFIGSDMSIRGKKILGKEDL